MEIHTNIPLKNYVTMRLGGNARFMADAHAPLEIAELVSRAKSQQLTIHVLGGGSNTVVRDEGFSGLILRPLIKGIEIVHENAGDITFKVGAGEIWDDFVAMSVEKNLIGIETLSGIPGTVGAAPVQNIGAYGQEVAETILSVDAYNMRTDTFVTLQSADCGFGYRDSIFRSSEIDRYIITHVTFRLYRGNPQPPFYQGVQDYLDQHNITIYTPRVIRDAVLDIRHEKLPDPKERPNSGSFFKNAIVEQWQYTQLIADYPDMPSYEMVGLKRKIPTGWLIEKAGLKGQLLHGMRVHDKNALVLINESASSYADLAAARSEIISGVRDTFHVEIEQEPLEI
jgi:UDP-N-acetylmuramate dehydrogenase